MGKRNSKEAERPDPVSIKENIEYLVWLAGMPLFIALAVELGKVYDHDFTAEARKIFEGVPHTGEGLKLAEARLLEHAADFGLMKAYGRHFSVNDLLGREAQTPEDVKAALQVSAVQMLEDFHILNGGKTH
jgi:hypothetical protein